MARERERVPKKDVLISERNSDDGCGEAAIAEEMLQMAYFVVQSWRVPRGA